MPPPATSPASLLFLFVDGLGLRDAAPDNPVNAANCPELAALLRDRAVPLDACLGVPGLPQSATGQAALFTGLNVPRLLGKHVSGFPGPRIRALIEQDNLFLRLNRAGVACKFANGYFSGGVAEISTRRWRSVTTVMALTLPATISTRDDLRSGRAVTEDLTRHGIRARGYDGPLIDPEEAAGHLIALVGHHGFVLFEYFQTDRVGHTRSLARAAEVLGRFDRFLRCLTARLDHDRTLLVLTSDHGNVEAMETPAHTSNPVPFVALGPGAARVSAGLRDLTDVTPRIVDTLTTMPHAAAPAQTAPCRGR